MKRWAVVLALVCCLSAAGAAPSPTPQVEDPVNRAFKAGKDAFSIGQWAEAVKDLEQVRKSRPAHQPTLLMLGIAYKQLGKNAEAEEALKKSVAVGAQFTQGYVQLCDLYLSQKKFDLARQQPQAILQYDVQNAEAYYLLGVVAYEQGHLPDSVTQWEHAVKLYEDYASAQYNLGWARYEMRDFGQAELHIQKASLLKPHHALYEFSLGYVCWAAHESVKATTSFDAARNDAKGSAFGPAAQAFLAEQQKKWDDAITQGKMAADKEPRFAKAWVILAQAYQQKGDLKSARLAAEKAGDSDPNDFEAKALLASLPPVPPEPTESPSASPGSGWTPGVVISPGASFSPGSGWTPGVKPTP